MSEEIKNPGMELNDAALEGVSGGYHAWDRYKEIFCDRCDHKGCGSDYYGLYDFIDINKNAMPASYRECPFYD